MELLTISQAARVLGVSIWALRKWANAGRIPFTRLPGGHRRWSRAQISEINRTMQQPVGAK